jgi:hypothetical protein
MDAGIGTGAGTCGCCADRQQQELERFEAAGRDACAAATWLRWVQPWPIDSPTALLADAMAQDSGEPAMLSGGPTSSAPLPHRQRGPQPGGISRKLFKGVAAELEAGIPQLKAIYSDWHERAEALEAIGRMARTPPIDFGPMNLGPINFGRGGAGAADSGLRDDIREVLKHTLAQLHVLLPKAPTQFLTGALGSLGDDDAPGQVLLDEDQLEHPLMSSTPQSVRITQPPAGELGGEEQVNRSLFLVGDPMQSIYRFREASVACSSTSQRSRWRVSLTYLQLNQFPLQRRNRRLR